MSPSTVLVTGASRFIGGQLAARLAGDPTIARVIAVDAVPPVDRGLDTTRLRTKSGFSSCGRPFRPSMT